MGKLTDIQIRAWVRNGERFEGRSDGMGLTGMTTLKNARLRSTSGLSYFRHWKKGA